VSLSARRVRAVGGVRAPARAALRIERHAVVRRTSVGLLLALLAAVLGLVLGAGRAAASGEDVHGRLVDGDKPVVGVRIVVTTPDNQPVGEARTAADGSWAVPLPGPGSYRITLDTATLPPGEKLRDPSLASVVKDVITDQQRPQLFPLGAGTPTSPTHSSTDRTAQLVAEGLRFGLILSLAAVGLSLIYGTTGLVNFAHGELVTYGALVAYWLNVVHGIGLIAAGAIAVAICGTSGWLQDALFWGRLRRRGTGTLAMMIVSIGLALLVRYIFLYFYGGENKAYRDFQGQSAVKAGPVPVALAPVDYWSMAVAVVALLLVLLAVWRTRLGKAARAISDNPALAAASGIDVDGVIRVVWTVGGALAGLAGILLGLAQEVQFQMGQNILLLIFAAVTLGGLGTSLGALLGSLVIGVGIQLSTRVVSPELKNVGALGALIVILLIRPQGLLGRRERVG
jgi:neutral amino acid transport system permease protein